jgi:hypothetical protein
MEMSRFMNRQTKDEAEEVEAAFSDDVEDEVPPAPEAEATAEQAAPEETPRPRVGEHVEAVLRAAEDAAAKLVEEARAQAQEIRQTAEREASAKADDAERARAEAVSKAEAVRAATEDEAARLRSSAEEEAANVRADAERDAETFAVRTAARYEDLLNDTALAEDRLRRLVDGLRDVADRLDDLLEPAEDEEYEEPRGSALDEQEDATLEEALDPNQPRAGTWSE